MPGAGPAQIAFTGPGEGGTGFKRVAPPPAGSSKILISIGQPTDPAVGSPGAETGFWARPGADPRLSPGRALAPALQAALDEAGGAQAEAVRRLARADRAVARGLMARYGADFRRGAAQANLSLPFLLAVAVAESSGDSRAVSPRGARGLMQLMPGTAAALGVTDPFAPAQAVPGGARYLDAQLSRFGEDPLAALAAYNAGPRAVEDHDGAPPWPETRAYAPRILLAFAALRELCLIPPATPRAPCRPSAAMGMAGPLGD